LGASVGLFIGVIVSDAIGRRSTMLFSLFFTAFGILLVLVVDNIKIKCVGLVIWGSGAEIAFTLLFPYVTEIVTEN
jgi:MFS family permease